MVDDTSAFASCTTCTSEATSTVVVVDCSSSLIGGMEVSCTGATFTSRTTTRVNPLDSTATSYVSGRTVTNENCPDSFVWPFNNGSLPPVRRTLTAAPGTAAPVWSTTTPLRRPATCAWRKVAASNAVTDKANRRRKCIVWLLNFSNTHYNACYLVRQTNSATGLTCR